MRQQLSAITGAVQRIAPFPLATTGGAQLYSQTLTGGKATCTFASAGGCALLKQTIKHCYHLLRLWMVRRCVGSGLLMPAQQDGVYSCARGFVCAQTTVDTCRER